MDTINVRGLLKKHEISQIAAGKREFRRSAADENTNIVNGQHKKKFDFRQRIPEKSWFRERIEVKKNVNFNKGLRKKHKFCKRFEEKTHIFRKCHRKKSHLA